MRELDLSLVVLDKILDEDCYFNDALKQVFLKDVESRPFRKEVAGLVGCLLRHYLLLEYLTAEAGLAKRERRLTELVLGNNYFYRHFETAKLNAVLKEEIGELTYNLIRDLVEKEPGNDNFIPEDISRTSNKYLSLRFNAPEWLLKIFVHFGYGTTYRTLKKMAKPFPPVCRVRESLISVDEVLKIEGFQKTKIPALLVYKGKVPLKKLSVYNEGKIFQIRPATKFIFDKYRVEDPSQVMLYNGNSDSSLEKELIESYGSEVGMNIGVKNAINRPEIYKILKERQLKNVNFFDCKDPLSMEAYISDLQELVFCAPNSTNFDLIPFIPDYILHFKKEDMTKIFEEEKAALHGCSKFVRLGGLLVYMVYTISKKEGRGIVTSFLENHKNFKVIEESQIFPYQELDTSLYVAVMEKVEEEDTVLIPGLSTTSTYASVSISSASEK